MKIAILGWGSLLWDYDSNFDQQHSAWDLDGPTLPLEFSRKSDSRRGALTLVIDRVNGSPCRVAYCFSKRQELADAIADLRCREGTLIDRIGFILPDHCSHGRDAAACDAITKWASERQVDSVIWTDLSSNFSKFSVQKAITYIQSLDACGKAKAAEYIWRAPSFIRTKLRNALESEPWFQATG